MSWATNSIGATLLLSHVRGIRTGLSHRLVTKKSISELKQDIENQRSVYRRSNGVLREVFEYRICLILANYSSFTSLSNDRSLQSCLFSTLDTFDSNPQARHLPTTYTSLTSTSSTLQSVPATSDPAPLPLSPTPHSPSHPHAPQSTRSATVPHISPHHPPSPLTTSQLAHAAQPRHPGESS